MILAACGGGPNQGDAGPPVSLGTTHDGMYNLGPVDWAESQTRQRTKCFTCFKHLKHIA